MVGLKPGDYVRYRQVDSKLPPWPAVICTDDMAPKSVRTNRPHGYYSLVLLLGEKLDFNYVLTSELLAHTSIYSRDELVKTAGLKEAYDAVDFALDAQLGLDFWRSETKAMRSSDTPPTPREDSNAEMDLDLEPDCGSDRSFHSDRDMKEAIKRSLLDLKGSGKSGLPTPPISPLHTYQIKKRMSTPPRLEFSHKHQKKKRTIIAPRPEPSQSNDIRAHFSPRKPASSQNGRVPGPSQWKEVRATIRKEDVIEDDLNESKDFVEFLVGPEKSSYIIPKKEIDRRQYFQSAHSNHLRARGKKGWSFDSPCLQHIDPEDFNFVADFLLSGDFGHRVIETEEQRSEAMVQCVCAWEVADQLGMEDLLRLVAQKIENTKPWATGEVLCFAIIVYRTPGTLLDSLKVVKSQLSSYIANNFMEMLSDHGDAFADKLKQIPELCRDVHQTMADQAKEKMDADDGKD